jgi:hypothetical protein
VLVRTNQIENYHQMRVQSVYMDGGTVDAFPRVRPATARRRRTLEVVAYTL